MMKKLKTIVVEDERLPRLSLLSKLKEYCHIIQVVDNCESYEEARDSILQHCPDLLFLDIQLRGGDSIQMLEELSKTIPLPYVIFTTAYSDRKYLMSAIKLSAVDYLLKPIEKEELAHAIAKAVNMVSANSPTLSPSSEKLCFRTVNGKIFIATDDIAYIKAEGNYAYIFTYRHQDLVMENLLSLEQRLPADAFSRVDRSTIVNVTHVYRLNHRDHACTFLSANGSMLELNLTKKGIEQLIEVL